MYSGGNDDQTDRMAGTPLPSSNDITSLGLDADASIDRNNTNSDSRAGNDSNDSPDDAPVILFDANAIRQSKIIKQAITLRDEKIDPTRFKTVIEVASTQPIPIPYCTHAITSL